MSWKSDEALQFVTDLFGNPHMLTEFQYDVFLSHSAKDKAVVRPVAERLRKDGLKVWLDEWVLKPGDSIPAKIEEGLERSRVLVLCMSANAFGSDWAQLEAGTFRFRDPLNQERRFIPVRLDDALIKGSLAQFLYINWLPAEREQEYPKLLEACRYPAKWPRPPKDNAEGASTARHKETPPELNAAKIQSLRGIANARRNEWKRLQADFEAQARKYTDLQLWIIYINQDGPSTNAKFDQAHYAINLWQYYGTGIAARERLCSSELTDFGVAGAEVGAYAVVVGAETQLFCRMASRAGSLLPHDIDNPILDNIRVCYGKPTDDGLSIVVANSNPLAKWLNFVLLATAYSHPGRFQPDTLAVDPFVASLTAFDLFLASSVNESYW